jgi:hypothetical protein
MLTSSWTLPDLRNKHQNKVTSTEIYFYQMGIIRLPCGLSTFCCILLRKPREIIPHIPAITTACPIRNVYCFRGHVSAHVCNIQVQIIVQCSAIRLNNYNWIWAWSDTRVPNCIVLDSENHLLEKPWWQTWDMSCNVFYSQVRSVSPVFRPSRVEVDWRIGFCCSFPIIQENKTEFSGILVGCVFKY